MASFQGTFGLKIGRRGGRGGKGTSKGKTLSRAHILIIAKGQREVNELREVIRKQGGLSWWLL